MWGFLRRCVASAPGVPSDTVIGRRPRILEPTARPKSVVPGSYRRRRARRLSPAPTGVPGLRPARRSRLRRCAGRLHRGAAGRAAAGVDAWWAAFAYEGVARELVARVKYRNARAAVPWLADAMVDGCACPRARPRSTSSPGHPPRRERRRARGFDPAELLARAVARRLRRPGAPRLLDRGRVRRRPGSPAPSVAGGPRFVGPARASPRVGAARRRRRHHRGHARGRGAALRRGGARATSSRSPRPGHHRPEPHSGPVRILRRSRPRRRQDRCGGGQMDIVVRGKNRTVPSRLDAADAREGVAHRASSRTTPGASRSTSPRCTPRASESQLCEITVHLKRHFVKAHAAAAEPEAALDLAVDKAGTRSRASRRSGSAGRTRADAQRQRHRATARSPTATGDGDARASEDDDDVGRADREDEAVRGQADGPRGSRAPDGAARPRLLPLHQHRDRPRRGALPPKRRRPRADRAPARPEAAGSPAGATTKSSSSNTTRNWRVVEAARAARVLGRHSSRSTTIHWTRARSARLAVDTEVHVPPRVRERVDLGAVREVRDEVVGRAHRRVVGHLATASSRATRRSST